MVLHEKYAAVDRIEDLLPLSLEIARFKIWGARRKSVRRGETTQVSVDDLPLAGREPDPLEQTERRRRLDDLEVLRLRNARRPGLQSDLTIRARVHVYFSGSFPSGSGLMTRYRMSLSRFCHKWGVRPGVMITSPGTTCLLVPPSILLPA